MAMNLTGPQMKELLEALLEAFPSYKELARLVSFQFDENLGAIAGGGSLTDTAFELIQWARSRGYIEQLIRGALEENPTNPTLREVAERLLPSQGPSPSPATPTLADAEPRTQLRDALVGLFKRAIDASSIAVDAGLSLVDMNLSLPIADVWDRLIQEADRSGQLSQLVEVGLRKYPNDPGLNAVARQLRSLPSAVGAGELLDRIVRLLPSQFEMLVFQLGVPIQFLSGSTAPQATRAIELLRWAESAGTVEKVAIVLDAVAGKRR